jgi:hypothetical protein
VRTVERSGAGAWTTAPRRPGSRIWAVGHDHLVLGRNLVETLRALFPDDMHRATAARANGALGFDCDVDARAPAARRG